MGHWLGVFCFYVFKYINKCIGLIICCGVIRNIPKEYYFEKNINN